MNALPVRARVEPVLAAEVDAEAEPVARHVAGPEAAALDRVAALDPRDVVADREGVLVAACGRRCAPRRRCWSGRNVPARELERREPEPVGAEARRVLDAELGRDVRRQEGALPLRVVEVVAGAELVDDRRPTRIFVQPPITDAVLSVGVERRQVGERVARLEDDAVRIAVLIAAAEEHRVVGARLGVEPDVGALPLRASRHELLVDAVPPFDRRCPDSAAGRRSS